MASASFFIQNKAFSSKVKFGARTGPRNHHHRLRFEKSILKVALESFGVENEAVSNEIMFQARIGFRNHHQRLCVEKSMPTVALEALFVVSTVQMYVSLDFLDFNETWAPKASLICFSPARIRHRFDTKFALARHEFDTNATLICLARHKFDTNSTLRCFAPTRTQR